VCAGSLVLGIALPAPGHVLLDPDVAEGVLAEIARLSKESRKGTQADEAVYRLGVTVETLVGLMNQDAAAHGQSDVLAQLIVKRLEANQVAVRVRDGRFEYDLAAFREYLWRAPSGPRAAAARFRLIAQDFYRSSGDDPLRTDGADLAGLRSAIEEEERFLRDYPADASAKEVQFFLAVDYCRLQAFITEPVRPYLDRCRAGLRDVMARRPGTMEARAAEALLGRLAP
jgi:hypothetical protein